MPTPATIFRAVCSGFEVATASRSPAARSCSSSAGTPGKSGVWVAATRSYYAR